MIKILDHINQNPYNFFFLVVDDSLDITLPELKNFYLIYAYKNPRIKFLKEQNISYFCLEEHGIKLKVKNSGKLLSNPKVITYIKNISQQNKRTPAIIPFKPSAKIDNICQKQGWLLVSNPASTNRLLEDKIKFPQLCAKYNISQIPYAIGKFNQEKFTKYQNEFGQKLVVQTHFGWAGNSTYLLSDWQTGKRIIPLNSQVKFSPFKEGYTLLNNCCLTRHGLIQSPPALQFTGIKPLTQNPFTTVGRQWPSTAPQNILNQVKDITEKFSKILIKQKYRGFFGLDFFVEKDQVYLLECNPRLTASFAFYTGLEKAVGITPLFYFHLAELTNIKYSIDIEEEQSRFSNPEIIGTELTPKNKDNITIKKIHIPSTIHSVQNYSNLNLHIPNYD
ncbi:MAG: ATP-grasp domain-containing protein [Patescibacteria group bacterium]|jgi:hypothetical protein